MKFITSAILICTFIFSISCDGNYRNFLEDQGPQIQEMSEISKPENPDLSQEADYQAEQICYEFGNCPLNPDCGRKDLNRNYLSQMSSKSALSLNYLWKECALSWDQLLSYESGSLVKSVDAVKIIVELFSLEKFCEEASGHPFQDEMRNYDYWFHLSCAFHLGLFENIENFHPDKHLSVLELEKLLNKVGYYTEISKWESSSEEISTTLNWEELVNLLGSVSPCMCKSNTCTDPFACNQEDFACNNFVANESNACDIQKPNLELHCSLKQQKEAACSGKSNIIPIFCEIENLGEEASQLKYFFLSFADSQDRESCAINIVNRLGGSYKSILPGQTVPAFIFEIYCWEQTWDHLLNMSFNIFPEGESSWIYDVDFLIQDLQEIDFSLCPDPNNVEGWHCDPNEGYPLWISSPEASVSIFNSEATQVITTIPDHGQTLFFQCQDLPAIVLIEGEKDLQALAYGHDLPNFSVWYDYQFEPELFPSELPDRYTGELDQENVEFPVLIRIPALDPE